MKAIDRLLSEYGESHQNSTNKLIHWVCVPLIMFSLLGLLMSIPFVMERSLLLNWASIFFYGTLLYYLRLSLSMFLGFILIGGIMIFGNYSMWASFSYDAQILAIVSAIVFFVAWVGQFIGHKIEGKKPSFIKDLQFLLIGPAWLMHFIFRKIGIGY
jgi:uncharacterized membrane protein YGL010W